MRPSLRASTVGLAATGSSCPGFSGAATPRRQTGIASGFPSSAAGRCSIICAALFRRQPHFYSGRWMASAARLSLGMDAIHSRDCCDSRAASVSYRARPAPQRHFPAEPFPRRAQRLCAGRMPDRPDVYISGVSGVADGGRDSADPRPTIFHAQKHAGMGNGGAVQSSCRTPTARDLRAHGRRRGSGVRGANRRVVFGHHARLGVAAAPFLVLWIAAPGVALWISLPPQSRRESPLSAGRSTGLPLDRPPHLALLRNVCFARKTTGSLPTIFRKRRSPSSLTALRPPISGCICFPRLLRETSDGSAHWKPSSVWKPHWRP